MGPIDWQYLLYVQVFPFAAIFYTLVLVFLRIRMPKSIWTMIGAWMDRGRISVGWIYDDDGWFGPEIIKSELGQGIFENLKGLKSLLMRPIASEKKTDTNGEPDETAQAEEDEKVSAINEIISQRYRMDIGKTAFIGYRGKALLVPPNTLKAIKDAKKGKLDVLDAGDLKVYFPKTINPSQLDSMENAAYWDGYYDKPLSETLKKYALPGMLFLVALFALYLVAIGKLKIPGVTI